MKPAQWIILSEYARHLGVSANVVTRAIDKGRIPASAVSRVPMPGVGGTSERILINKTEADPAWVAGFNEISANPTLPARLAVGRIRAELENPAPDSENIPEPPTPEPPQNPAETRKTTDLMKVQLSEKTAKAGLAQIELLEKRGKLVSKDAVYKQLFESGQQLRDSLMSIPDRITAEILSAGNNHVKVRQILSEAIATSLESFIELCNSKNIGKV